MSEVSYIEPLTPEEKAERDHLESIIARGIGNFIETGEALYQVKVKGLFRETYRTWTNYCEQRWGIGRSRASQLINAMETAKELAAVTGVNAQNEAVVREVKTHPAEHRPKILTVASTLAETEGIPLNTRHVKAAAAQVMDTPLTGEALNRQRVYNSKFSMIKQWMDTGRIKPDKAVELCTEITACDASIRMWMLQNEITNPVMVRELSAMHRRGSETFAEIMASGRLEMPDGSQIPIGKATPAHLRIVKDAKYKEHLARVAAERDAAKGIEEVLMTLYLNCPQKNADMIISMLGKRNAREVARALNSQLWKSRTKHRRPSNVYVR
jgi:hypothetical protein